MRLTLLSWAKDPNGRLKSGGDVLLLRYIYSTSEIFYSQGEISLSAQSAWLSAALLLFFFFLRRDAVNPLQALRGCSVEHTKEEKKSLPVNRKMLLRLIFEKAKRWWWWW